MGRSSATDSQDYRKYYSSEKYSSDSSNAKKSSNRHKTSRENGRGKDMSDNNERKRRMKPTTDEEHSKEVEVISKGLAQFSSLSNSIEKRLSLFNTRLDTRANHVRMKEEIEKCNNICNKMQYLLKKMADEKDRLPPNVARARNAHHRKLFNDFKVLKPKFDGIVQKVISSERESVGQVRRSSVRQTRNTSNLGNFDEDQLYANANIVEYDEEQLQRREDDILHINRQLYEVNDTYRRLDQLVEEQDETIVEIADNAEHAKVDTDRAVEQLLHANKKSKYCRCSKMKIICFGIFFFLVCLIALLLITAIK